MPYPELAHVFVSSVVLTTAMQDMVQMVLSAYFSARHAVVLFPVSIRCNCWMCMPHGQGSNGNDLMF